MSKTYLFAAMMLGLPLAALGEIRCNKVYSEYSALEELCAYQEGLAAFKIRYQWGFVDAAGKVVVEPIYDEVSDFVSGLAAVSVDKKWGFIDRSGALRIPMQYAWVTPFSEGLSAVHLDDDSYGYIDAENRLVIPAIYQRADAFKNGVAVVEDKAGQRLLIDKTGKVIKTFGSDVSLDGWGQHFGHYVATVKYPRFLVNAEGRRVELPPGAGSDPAYSDGVLVVSKMFDRELLHGVMDLDGKWLLEPRFADIGAYSAGLAIVTVESKSEMRERTHGLIDKRGEIVVQPIYSRLDRSKQGLYLGHHKAPDVQTDIFDAAGKLLFSAKSDIYESLSQGGWTVLSSSGEGGGSWVISPRGTSQHIAISSPETSQVGDYLLLSKKNESKESENEGESESFFLLGPQGLVLSSEDPGVKGKYDWAWLISPEGNLARAKPELLPLAMLVKGYRQMAILTRDHKLISQSEWTYESELLDYKYNSSNKALEGPFVIKAGEAWGAIDGKGQWVIPPDFSRLTPFRNGLSFGVQEGEEVMVDNTGRVIAFPPGRAYRRIAPFLIAGFDESGGAAIYRIRDGQSDRLALPPGVALGEHFEEGLITARIDEKWGLLDTRDGRWALAPAYPGEPESLRQEGGPLLGWKTTIHVELEKKTVTRRGLVSPLGQEVVKPVFSEIDADYQKGPLLRTSKDSRKGGMIDANGREILPNIYESMDYTDHGWYLARRAEQKGVINTRGDWTVQPGPYWFNQLETRPYGREEADNDKMLHVHVDGTVSTRDKPQPMADDLPAYWWSAVEGPYGQEQTVFYGFDWKERLRLPGEGKDDFSNGWLVLKTGEKKRGFPSALANSEGKIIGPLPYDHINPFSNGLFLVRQGAEEARQGRRFGFINAQGKVAIPLKFEAADDFSEDRAIVLSRGNLGAIDKSGKLILHSAWLCGNVPVLLDGKEKIIWPKGEKPVCQ